METCEKLAAGIVSSRLFSAFIFRFSHLKDADMLWLRAGTPSAALLVAVGVMCLLRGERSPDLN